ncbi:DNA alkylation repair protein [Metamycoplasma buccale]|uniref:DNA alkylation repair protein n=1 Tax=Metamycoplasma buccale TaxID=55602 RepID=UPI00398F31A2
MKSQDITNELLKNIDDVNKNFVSKLVPTIDKNIILGIKIPILRKKVNFWIKNDLNLIKEFINFLPHKYLEEDLIHVLYINKISNFDEVIKNLKIFLPYVNNWMVCDTLNPISFCESSKLYSQIKIWINNKETYTIRFGIKMLLKHFIKEKYLDESTNIITNIKNDDYYVKMMIAWYLSEVFVKYPSYVTKLLENKKMDSFIHNKTIQKCIESFRIDKKLKEYLKTLKVKHN